MSQSEHPLRRSTATQDTAKKSQTPTPTGPTAAPLDQLQRAAIDPRAASPGTIATLQRQYGNRAVGGWLNRAQEALNADAVTDKHTYSPQDVVQRRSDKLPTKATLTGRAKGGFALGQTSYDKVLSAIDTYHKMGSLLYLGQLGQLIKIYDLLVEWEIAHGMANAGVTSKDTKETNRRGVLTDVKADYLPKEIADVYGQAKTANVNVPVPLMMQLMNASDGDKGARAVLQADYATKLRTYNASDEDTATASSILKGKGATKLKEAGASESWTRDHENMKNYDAEAEFGMYVSDVSTIDPQSRMGQEIAQGNRNAQVASSMSEIEFMALRAYSSHAYTEMNTEARRLNPSAKGGDKKAREKSVSDREENQQLNLMATSALNKLPPWDGSTLYRGEDCDWGLKPGGPVQAGATVVLPSFTSTSATKSVAEGFSHSGSSDYVAVWEIRGVRNSGSQLGKFAAIQNVSTGKNAEDEILLKQYSALRIVSITPVTGKNYKYYIVATGN